MTAVDHLPTYAALEVLPVLEGWRPGASIQFDRVYLDELAAALERHGDDERLATVRETRRRFDELAVDVDRIAEEPLYAATETVRARFADLPEVRRLVDGFDGETLAVPEWFDAGGSVEYGVRLLFFPAGSAPDAEPVLRRSVRAATESRAEYQTLLGALLGYPDCCVAFFGDRGTADPPEWRSTAPFLDAVDRSALRAGASLDAVLPDFLDRPGALAFFARGFYPEPDCRQAVARGRRTLDLLTEVAGPTLARDHVRLNYLYGLRLARTVVEADERGRPRTADLGPAYRQFFLPFERIRDVERYAP